MSVTKVNKPFYKTGDGKTFEDAKKAYEHELTRGLEQFFKNIPSDEYSGLMNRCSAEDLTKLLVDNKQVINLMFGQWFQGIKEAKRPIERVRGIPAQPDDLMG